MSKSIQIFAILAICIVTVYGIFLITDLPTFSIWRWLVFFVPLLIYITVILTHRDSLTFVLVSTFAALPLLGIIMPPARLQIFIFDIFSSALFLILIARKMQSRDKIDLFPVRYVWIPILFFIPSLLTAISLRNSFIEILRFLRFYIVFVTAYHYLQKPGWINKFHLLIALGLAITAFSVILQKITGVSFMLYQERGLVDAGGSMIKQGTGFFQDPQKAGQFMAVFLTYFTILWSKKALHGKWLKRIALLAIVLSIPALLITVSRLAIASGLAASAIGFFLLNKSSLQGRFFVISILLVLLSAFKILGNGRLIEKILPVEVVKRFETAETSYEGRFQIWKDSWHIFKVNPVTGIGPGNYQEYWMQKYPYLRKTKEAGGYVPDQPENGYLKILYEGGLLGSIGALYFLSGFIRTVVRNLNRKKDEIVRSNAWASLIGLAVFLATFTTLFTISDPRNALIPLILLMVLLAGRTELSNINPAVI